MNGTLNSLLPKYNVWNMTNRTKEFSEGGEEGQLDLIVSDKHENHKENRLREDDIRTEVIKNFAKLPATIANINVSCYSLETLMGSQLVPINDSQKNGYDIFISYSAQNEDMAAKLRALFDNHGFSCFLSGKDLEPGSVWADEVRTALSSSKEFIILYSRQSKDSVWVQMEVGAAWAFKKKINPIILDCEVDELPSHLHSYQATKFTELDHFVDKLRNRIR